MRLTSPAFHHGSKIPLQFTGEGDNFSPPLEWSDIPQSTKTLALLCEDIDAPHADGGRNPFVHWLVFNIPAALRMLPEGILPNETVEAPLHFQQGMNSFGNIGYGGPLPPLGHGSHRYRFRLFSLDVVLELQARATSSQLFEAMGKHVLETAELVGTFERESGRKLAG